VEQKLHRSNEIERLVDIGVLEEDYPSEWASTFPSFAIHKKIRTIRVFEYFRKLNILLIPKTSRISYSKDWAS
jgi:hypothetical protein